MSHNIHMLRLRNDIATKLPCTKLRFKYNYCQIITVANFKSIDLLSVAKSRRNRNNKKPEEENQQLHEVVGREKGGQEPQISLQIKINYVDGCMTVLHNNTKKPITNLAKLNFLLKFSLLLYSQTAS